MKVRRAGANTPGGKRTGVTAEKALLWTSPAEIQHASSAGMGAASQSQEDEMVPQVDWNRKTQISYLSMNLLWILGQNPLHLYVGGWIEST